MATTTTMMMIVVVVVVVLFLVMVHEWNEIDRGTPKYSGENLSQCHFADHRSHVD
jgi:uncharacterized membrane protein